MPANKQTYKQTNKPSFKTMLKLIYKFNQPEKIFLKFPNPKKIQHLVN